MLFGVKAIEKLNEPPGSSFLGRAGRFGSAKAVPDAVRLMLESVAAAVPVF